MPSPTNIQNTLLSASLLMANDCIANLAQLSVGNDELDWSGIRRLNRNINALQYQYNTAQYDTSQTLVLYSCLNSLIGFDTTVNNLDPNYENPGVVYDITNVITATGNFTRIPFNGITNVSLANFQSTYALIYGSDAIVSIWVTQDNFATVQQDTGTVPTITNLGGDINKPNDYEWVYPFATSGYVQINGFTPQGGNTSAGLPITNLSFVLLDDATLNGLYPTALWGQLILLPNANARYEKLDNSPTGSWDYQPYNPNT